MSQLNVDSVTATNVTATGTVTGTNGIKLPSYADVSRPGSSTGGTMIYNSTVEDVEIWKGGAWASLGGSTLATWTTDTRPANPVVAQFGLNTETYALEVWNGSDWVTIASTGAGGGATAAGFTLVAGSAVTYDWSGDAIIGPSDFDAVLDTIPADTRVFLRYPILVGGSQVSLCAGAYVNLVSGTRKLSQSCFSLGSANTVAYSGSAVSATNFANDDNDSWLMDADGQAVIARSNANSFSGNWDRVRGSSATQTNIGTSSAFIADTSLNGSNNECHYVSFPKTGKAVFFDWSNNRFAMNGFSTVSYNITQHIGGGGSTNSIWSISDGISSVVIGRHGSTTAWYGEFNLTDGTVYYSEVLTVNTASSYNDTEEDMNGNQLFALDGAVSFHADDVFHWRTDNLGYRASIVSGDPFTKSGCSTFTAGSSNSQAGMDIMASVGNDGYLWFGDWGHDNGGLFGIGNDSDFGTRKTNIQQLSATYFN